jgi:isoquinoline 1-oxidoreductase beta subunit
MGKWTRRAFIGTGTLAGGGCVLGVAGLALAPSRHSVVREHSGVGDLTTWITITPDNLVTVLVPHCEMGQGTHTALAMMAAEEMNADWSLVRAEEAPALDVYANAYIARPMAPRIPGPMVRGIDYGGYRLARWFGFMTTGGSLAVRGTGVYGMRVAGAAAKEMLLAAAAQKFGVAAADCQAANSRVTHAASGRSATFGELAALASRVAVPSSPVLKSPDSYTIRRTAKPRLDIPAKVDGRARYAIDFTRPEMLHAAIEMAPAAGGKLTSIDPAPAEAMPGVKKVVRLDDAVAVVADTYWQARRGLAALKPVFDDGGTGGVSTKTIFAAFDQALGPAAAMPASTKAVTADYRVPFLAHATMEPMVCTASVQGGPTGDRVEVWTGVQDPLNARSVAAKALGVDAEHVVLTNFLLGGGFGRRLPFTYDYVEQSVRIAKAMSPALVKLIWTRENDIQHDYYRPAAMARFAGALDTQGAPLAVHVAYAGGGDGESTHMPYAIADKKATARDAKHPIRTGAWRSVLNSQHGFFKESFVDELAHAAGKDPFRFRADLLGAEPRHRAVLERAASMSQWGTPLPPREGRGIALVESFGTIVAQVAHVAVSDAGAVRVKHVWVAVDCGDVVNTDSAAAQAEGGVIFGLSAALVGEITIDGGRVVERNFRDHRMIRMADAPQIESVFLRSDAPIGGLGEPCVPPIAPAVANAIFAATGTRVRELPISKAAGLLRSLKFEV